MNFYVYGYFEPESEIPFYIGKGSKDRAWDHVKDSRLFYFNTHFYQKLRKLVREGLEPVIRIIQDSLSEQEAFDMEIKLIKQYGRLDKGTGCLCNHTDGGEGSIGFQHSDGTKALLSLLQKRHPVTESTRISMSGSTKGLAKSQATRTKISLAGIRRFTELKIRKNHNSFLRIPVESFDLKTGQVIQKYTSQHNTARDGFNPKAVNMVVCGHRKSHRGLGWRYSK